ncbi:uncharacterized protein LOC131148901 [Malania oleifera]|uniref:uncharacterized protein LOC131148901 n=1 Tax=Malania oleifera TaxID=397392 RepID=UPI0025AE48CC|nr:uncharacterized protein LOC131148901 [Malania oleifera]
MHGSCLVLCGVVEEMALVFSPVPTRLKLKPSSCSPSFSHRWCSSRQSITSSFCCRPAVILPGLGNNSGDYDKFARTLEGYGVPIVVAKVSRFDWFRNAAGLVDPNYWRGTLRPRPVLDWYLKRIDEAVHEAKQLAQGGTISLIGHSAGGWLARVYMEEFGFSHISLLLTLGSPHQPPPKGSSGVIDQTRGLLDYVAKHCTKAVCTQELKFVCIAGRYVRGARFFGNSEMNANSVALIDNAQSISKAAIGGDRNNSTSIASTLSARFVGQGYKQVCGQADVWGDGVVPEVSAHLAGALNISFDGVYHAPVGSDDELRPWYGSPAIVDQWIHLLLS